MWYRAMKMSGTVYARPFYEDCFEDEFEDIETFVREGYTVVLADDLDQISEIFDVKLSDIEVVGDD